MMINGTRISIILLTLLMIFSTAVNAEKIALKGKVTDFKGKPVEGALVEVKNRDFSTAAETLSRKDGSYTLQVDRGRYIALASMRMDEYPKQSKLPRKDQKLEFWLWNLIADKDLEINIRYHKLEVYGVNIFRIQGATPGYTIYFRPMSLTRYFSSKASETMDLCPDKDEISIKVEVNGKPLKINSLQKVSEYVKKGLCYGYIVHVPLHRNLSDDNYDIFRIVVEDLKNGDKGEAIYMKEKWNYK